MLLFVLIGVVFYFFGYVSVVYGVVLVGFGVVFLVFVVDIWCKWDGDLVCIVVICLFKYLIFYFFMLFVLFLGESLVVGV